MHRAWILALMIGGGVLTPLFEANAAPGAPVGIEVGIDPHRLSVDPVLHQAYVGNSGSASLSIIDTTTGAVVATLAMPCRGSGQSAVDPATHRVYVVNHDCAQVTVLDGATRAVVAGIGLGGGSGPVGIAVDAAARRGYVARVYAGTVAVLDLEGNRVVGALPVPGQPTQVGVDAGTVYVGFSATPTPGVAVFGPGATSPTCTMSVQHEPRDFAMDALRRLTYVSSGPEVLVLDGPTCRIVDRIALPGDAAGLALDLRRQKLYVAMRDLDELAVVSLADERLVRVPAGDGPNGVGILEARVFVTNDVPTPGRVVVIQGHADLRIRAWIDGRSQVLLRGTELWWHHDDFAAPGVWTGAAEQPTYLNGQGWWPSWPQPGENRDCHCDSSRFELRDLGLRQGAAPIQVDLVEGRGEVRVEQPSAANGGTLRVELDDNHHGGAAWYEVRVHLAAAPMVIRLPSPRAFTAAATDGATVYVFGGRTATGYLDEILEFQPATGIVSSAGVSLPRPLGDAAAVWDPRDRPEAGCDGGCAYVIGGRFSNDRDYSALILAFNPQTRHVWAMKSTLPEGRSNPAAVFDGSRILIFGGGLGDLDGAHDRAFREVLVYDPVADNGVARTGLDLPQVRPGSYDSPVAVWTGSFALTFGGSTRGESVPYGAYRFEIDPPTVVHLSDAMLSGRNFGGAVWHDGRALMFGGCIGQPCQADPELRAIAFDPTTNAFSWATERVPSARYASAVVRVGSTAWLAGGTDASGRLLDKMEPVTLSLPDTRPPVIAPRLDGARGDDGSFRSTVRVALDATDPGSGVASVDYRLDDGPWRPYAMPFDVAKEGSTLLGYRGADRVGNSWTGTFPLRIDPRIPSVSLAPSPPWLRLPDGTLALGRGGCLAARAADAVPGVDWVSEVRAAFLDLEGLDPEVLPDASTADAVRRCAAAGSFTSQVGTALPWARDGAGNAGSCGCPWAAVGGYGGWNGGGRSGRPPGVAEHRVMVDTEPPATRLVHGDPSYRDAIGVFVGPATPFELLASDAGVGVAETLRAIDGGAFAAQHPGPFPLDLPDGAHEVHFYSVDRLGNAEEPRSEPFVWDATPPTAVIVNPPVGSVSVADETFRVDSDLDGYPDLVETTLGSDPEDAASVPDLGRGPLVVNTGPLTTAETRQNLSRAWVLGGAQVLLEVDAEDPPTGGAAAGVASVTFSLDGDVLAVDHAPPFEHRWNSADVAPGDHLLRIVAVDRLGNTGPSSVDTRRLHVLPGTPAQVEAVARQRVPEPLPDGAALVQPVEAGPLGGVVVLDARAADPDEDILPDEVSVVLAGQVRWSGGDFGVHEPPRHVPFDPPIQVPREIGAQTPPLRAGPVSVDPVEVGPVPLPEVPVPREVATPPVDAALPDALRGACIVAVGPLGASVGFEEATLGLPNGGQVNHPLPAATHALGAPHLQGCAAAPDPVPPLPGPVPLPDPGPSPGLPGAPSGPGLPEIPGPPGLPNPPVPPQPPGACPPCLILIEAAERAVLGVRAGAEQAVVDAAAGLAAALEGLRRYLDGLLSSLTRGVVLPH